MTSRRTRSPHPGRAAPAPLARSGLPWLAGFCTLIMGSAFAGQNAPAAAAAATADTARIAVRSDATAAAFDLRVRDSVSGRALPAQLSLAPVGAAAARQSLDLAAAGGRVAGLAPGEYRVTVSAPGYLPVVTTVHSDNALGLPTTVWLSPKRESEALDLLALKAAECSDCSVLSGHVYDQRTGQPLAGARVRSGLGERAVADADGYFELRGKFVNDASRQDAPPPTTSLEIEAPGYRAQRLEGLSLVNDSSHFVVDLQRGSGRSVEKRVHAQAEDNAAALREREALMRQLDADNAGQAMRAGQTLAAAQVSATAVSVPSSIRVGTSCSGRSCSGVSVYSLEDYVAKGLDEEWIPSWHAQSLAAGAVAYRTYGAYFVAHPISSRYDICNTTSCQVFNADSVSATVAAANATRGVILSRDGKSAAFSEYSSENNAWDDPSDGLSCSNNDLSCGNGNNGSPRNNWPCLSDSVGKGKGCFGHGRGMSQWGTQRWAANNGRDWKWITDHYFNNNNKPAGMRNAFRSDGGGSPNPGGAPGTVDTNGTPLNVRSGPGTGYSVVGTLADGSSVTIQCQTNGTSVTGTFGTSKIWNRIGSGRFIPDAYTQTGSDGRVAPDC
ncbi:SpoIID/LytB domain-containing protein [Lysobacter enzymogenes]|uniref:SpoIID/LytB domain-containing protein n=1 Tax=Lysobacter enzymogenes TaxID=69 RepID=UPI001A96E659|nr:SpoIID/LytB domain-containing protein [Lysobacter enzymogenes]QQP96567.1 SH3 domain-containing protein [Lysobacter enzymogenes]